MNYAYNNNYGRLGDYEFLDTVLRMCHGGLDGQVRGLRPGLFVGIVIWVIFSNMKFLRKGSRYLFSDSSSINISDS